MGAPPPSVLQSWRHDNAEKDAPYCVHVCGWVGGSVSVCGWVVSLAVAA